MSNNDLYDRDSLSLTLADLAKKLDIKGILEYNGFIWNINQLCTSYIYYYFKSSGITIIDGKMYKITELQEKLNIKPTFNKFLNFFLKVLAEDGILIQKEESIIFIKNGKDIEDCEKIENRLRQEYKEFKGLFDLLHQCYINYPKALSGEIPSILVLFPHGKQDFMTECSQNTVEYSKERILCRLIGEMLLSFIKNYDKGSKVKILEIGGGSARLTREIADVVNAFDVNYYFTDISPLLFKKVESQQLIQNVVYKAFDITKEPTAQGFEYNSFDLVIGLNVVHATKSISESIQNVTKLLAPEGYLMLIEDIMQQRWIDMIWGLADGWWSFEDFELRKDSPLISLDKWEKVLMEQNFSNIITLPSKDSENDFDCGLIVGRKQA